MAEVNTAISASIAVFPFTGYRDAVVTPTQAARAEVRAQARNQAIAAVGVGDNQSVTISMTLPENFAYVLTDFTLNILRTTAAATYNWPLQGELVFFDAVASGSRTREYQLGLTSPGTGVKSGDQELATYKPIDVYSGLVFTRVSGENMLFQADLFNQTANDGAYSLDVTARFLQFDINQAFALAVNTAVPVRM